MAPTDSCLTEKDKVWLAAIIDGEGCIRIARSRRKKGRKWRFQPTIELTNTDRRLVGKFVELTEPWVTRVRKYSNDHFHENAKARFQVEIRYQSCKPFIEAIRPYLICKGEQADLLLEFMKLQKEEGHSGKNMVPEYNELYIQSRLLNKRGTKPLNVEKLRRDIEPSGAPNN